MLVFITLVLQTGVVASSDFDFNAPPTTDDCLYGGRVYHPGYKFRPHHCVACHCPQKGGRVACSVEDCIEEPNCVRFANVTSQRLKTCCATCLEYGCRHTDGKMYHKGETISQDGCSRCYCPLKGGQITCDVKAKCPVALCVDLELRPGSCCPRCPNGKKIVYFFLSVFVSRTI